MQYYVANGQQSTGPFDIAQLRAMNITPETLVWNQSMTDWKRADQVNEIRTEVLGLVPLGAGPLTGGYGVNQGGYMQAPMANGGFGQPDLPPCPPNYLVWAILVTILCCVPLGIVSIIKASRVNSFYSQGLYEEAVKASEDAKKWAIISAVAGLVFSVIYFFVVFYGVNSGMY